MQLRLLADNTAVLETGGNLALNIESIVYDSREAKSGSLFVAVPGFETDGHLYIKNALDNGAEAVVIQDSQFRSSSYNWLQVEDCRKALADLSTALYGFPSRKLNTVGVTGTNGKTTTTNLIAAILEQAGYSTGLIGTIQNRIGNDIIPVDHTTPEAPELQGLFRTFLDKGAEYVVMEVSSHALDLSRVRGTEFDVAVFTNLTQDHLDFHQTMDQYLAAKGRLFSGLGHDGNKKRRKFAILNNDDPSSSTLAEMARVPVITYGIHKPADVKAEDVMVTAEGARFKLKYTDKEIEVYLQLTGLFNVYNSLAAIAVGLVEGINIETIIQSLGKVAGIPGRFERVDEGQSFTVIVDYSHTPDSLENCLKTAREFVQGKLITVFGCGGDRDRTKRPLMGQTAARLSDFSIVTSDNPRSEDPLDIIKDILPGMEKVTPVDRYVVIPDRKEAINKAIGQAKPHDVIIIAGKGHEDYQVIGGKILHFDDREVVREAIKSLTNWQ